jgi:hypothetical protein
MRHVEHPKSPQRADTVVVLQDSEANSNQTSTMRLFAVLLLMIFAQAGSAQFSVKKLDKNTIPRTLRYSGKLVHAARWTDSTGDNLVLLTKADLMQGNNASGEDQRSDALYAYHFISSGDSMRQTWRVYDFIKECPVDIFLDFVGGSFAVSDLDKNGKAEVWIVYKASCQGDVSPVAMKIIMYEKDKKFSLRGTTRVQVSEKGYAGGTFVFDEAFRGGPAVFRQNAERIWNRHKVETWGQ